nr:uncharacterized protein LOC127314696 isoform X1 [Lolium perenne]
MRLGVLVLLVSSIRAGDASNRRHHRRSSSAPAAKSSIPADLDLLRPNRACVRVPDLRCRPCSGGPPLPAPPSLRTRRRGASNALTHASREAPRRPLSSSPAAVTTPMGTRAASSPHRTPCGRARTVRQLSAMLAAISTRGSRSSASLAQIHPAFASSRIGSRSGDVRYVEFSDKFFCSFSQVRDDDVSKVTLPAWPGQGYGCHWLSSGLLVQFVSCPYSDVFDLLYDLDLCIVYLYLDSLESLL